MTAASSAIDRQAPSGFVAARRWIAPAALLGGLGAMVGGRWAATRAGVDPLLIGAVFGAGLLGVAAAGRRRHEVARSRFGPAAFPALVVPVALGVLAGLALVAITIVGSGLAGSAFVPGIGRPAAPLVPWAVITVVVAGAEEAVLRGRAFDAIRRVGGLVAAVVVTTIAFALMHVPLYGWGVVPLDLAVGLAFAGLRLATRGVAAPAAAHAVADLATWWL